MPEGPPRTQKPPGQQLTELKELQRALAEARETGDVAVAKALMEQHRDLVEPVEDSTVPSESLEGATLADDERILGKESVLGHKDVEAVFGKPDRIPAIPFSPQELERAKELGQQLILQVDTMAHPTERRKAMALTLENLKQKFTKAHDDGKVFFNQDWYKNEDFWKKEKPRVGWRLTSNDLLPESTSKRYLEQTDLLVEHLQKQVFKGMKLPKQYEDAIAEFKRKRAEIEPLATSSTDTE